jgi:serine/threonine protein kinase
MKNTKQRQKLIYQEGFNFEEGRVLCNKYEVVQLLGSGWEGEVYLLKELLTGIERAGKFFYPQRNPNNQTLRRYAKRLFQLRHCPIMMSYITQERTSVRGLPIYFLVSDYLEGEMLSDFIKRQPGKRLHVFQGLHLLHSLSKGFEEIHRCGEYHGDLHSENVMVERHGLGFDLRLYDLFHWDAPKKQNVQDDIVDMIKLFYEAIGGKKHYAKLPGEAKSICCGLKRSLILRKFKSAGMLRRHLETLEWS